MENDGGDLIWLWSSAESSRIMLYPLSFMVGGRCVKNVNVTVQVVERSTCAVAAPKKETVLSRPP